MSIKESLDAIKYRDSLWLEELQLWGIGSARALVDAISHANEEQGSDQVCILVEMLKHHLDDFYETFDRLDDEERSNELDAPGETDDSLLLIADDLRKLTEKFSMKLGDTMMNITNMKESAASEALQATISG